MSEKLNTNNSTAPQDRADMIDSVKDFITVSQKGRAHIPKGSGSLSGQYLSNHELARIDANKDQIEDGLEARNADFIVNRINSHDGQNELTDPSEIRDALVAGLDDLDFADADEYTDDEIMQFVADKKQEVANYYGTQNETAGKPKFSPSKKASGDEFDQNDIEELNKILVEEDEKANYVPKHRADNRDEDSPIFDQLKAERGESDEVAREGESLEEYNARQEANSGRHRLEKASTEGLDVVDVPFVNPLEKASTEGLDVIDTPAVEAAHEADVEQTTTTKLSWRDRLRLLATPAGLAGEMSARLHSTKEKLGNHKKATIGLGILAVAGSVTAFYLTHDSGGSGGSGTNGGGLKDLLTPPTGPKNPNATKELLDSSAWNIPKGSGGEALMERLGADKSTWYQHQNEFLNQFPGDAYRMPDGNVGFDDPGRLSKGAIKFWAKYASK